MKINWIEHESKASNGDYVSYFLLNMMANHGIEKFGKFDGENLEVKCQINGIEVNFEDTIKEVEQQHDRMLESKAKEILHEIEFDLEDIEVDLDEIRKEKRKELLKEKMKCVD